MLNLENLKPGEEVILVLRRHWIVYIFLGLQLLVGILITAIIIGLFPTQVWAYLLLVVFWLFMSIFMYTKWLDHELDLFVVSNNRIIGVEQLGFLNRSIGECNLGQVQDVKSNTKGLLSNLFDFGVLTIQTAGSSTNFSMGYTPNVIQSARKVLNIVDDYRDSENNNNSPL